MQLDGLLLADKPSGPTSHDIVVRVRLATGGNRVGHTGTLDPMATGLLVLCMGRATRLSRYVMRSRKTYAGALRLGVATDTYDAGGRMVSSADPAGLTRREIEDVAANLTGGIMQAPPPYSARKVGGRPLHEAARGGDAVVLVPVPVTVHRFAVLEVSGPDVSFVVETSAGTYVRSLVHDMGRMLGCGAHLTRLRRLASGAYRVEDALPPEEIERACAGGRIGSLVTPLSRIDLGIPSAKTSSRGAAALRAGRTLPAEEAAVPLAAGGSAVRVEDEAGDLVGVALLEIGPSGAWILRPRTILPW